MAPSGHCHFEELCLLCVVTLAACLNDSQGYRKTSKDCCVSIQYVCSIESIRICIHVDYANGRNACICMYTLFMNVLCHISCLYPNVELIGLHSMQHTSSLIQNLTCSWWIVELHTHWRQAQQPRRGLHTLVQQPYSRVRCRTWNAEWNGTMEWTMEQNTEWNDPIILLFRLLNYCSIID